jgi:hypothetical protein
MNNTNEHNLFPTKRSDFNIHFPLPRSGIYSTDLSYLAWELMLGRERNTKSGTKRRLQG